MIWRLTWLLMSEDSGCLHLRSAGLDFVGLLRADGPAKQQLSSSHFYMHHHGGEAIPSKVVHPCRSLGGLRTPTILSVMSSCTQPTDEQPVELAPSRSKSSRAASHNNKMVVGALNYSSSRSGLNDVTVPIHRDTMGGTSKVPSNEEELVNMGGSIPYTYPTPLPPPEPPDPTQIINSTIVHIGEEYSIQHPVDINQEYIIGLINNIYERARVKISAIVQRQHQILLALENFATSCTAFDKEVIEATIPSIYEDEMAKFSASVAAIQSATLAEMNQVKTELLPFLMLNRDAPTHPPPFTNNNLGDVPPSIISSSSLPPSTVDPLNNNDNNVQPAYGTFELDPPSAMTNQMVVHNYTQDGEEILSSGTTDGVLEDSTLHPTHLLYPSSIDINNEEISSSNLSPTLPPTSVDPNNNNNTLSVIRDLHLDPPLAIDSIKYVSDNTIDTVDRDLMSLGITNVDCWNNNTINTQEEEGVPPQQSSVVTTSIEWHSATIIQSWFRRMYHRTHHNSDDYQANAILSWPYQFTTNQNIHTITEGPGVSFYRDLLLGDIDKLQSIYVYLPSLKSRRRRRRGRPPRIWESDITRFLPFGRFARHICRCISCFKLHMQDGRASKALRSSFYDDCLSGYIIGFMIRILLWDSCWNDILFGHWFRFYLMESYDSVLLNISTFIGLDALFRLTFVPPVHPIGLHGLTPLVHFHHDVVMLSSVGGC